MSGFCEWTGFPKRASDSRLFTCVKLSSACTSESSGRQVSKVNGVKGRGMNMNTHTHKDTIVLQREDSQ